MIGFYLLSMTDCLNNSEIDLKISLRRLSFVVHILYCKVSIKLILHINFYTGYETLHIYKNSNLSIDYTTCDLQAKILMTVVFI